MRPFTLFFVVASTFIFLPTAHSKPKSCSAQINYLNKFLKLEIAGGRLHSEGRIYSMTTDETQWETSTVVKSYALESCDLARGDARITVSFEVIGTMASSPSGEPDFIKESKNESYDFFVSKEGHHLKVLELTDFRPHVAAWAAAHAINPEDGQVAKRSIASLKGPKH
jgi:hypothetical protein